MGWYMKIKCSHCNEELRHVFDNYYICPGCGKKYIKKTGIEKFFYAMHFFMLYSIPALINYFSSKAIAFLVFAGVNFIFYWLDEWLYYIWSDKQFVEIKEDNNI